MIRSQAPDLPDSNICFQIDPPASVKQEQVQIGQQARLTPKEALEALEAARNAWDNGKGEWPLTPFQVRPPTPETLNLDQP